MNHRVTFETGVTRRGFLKGLAGIFAAGVAPAAIGSNVLMPVRNLWVPPENFVAFNGRLWIPGEKQIVGVDVSDGYDYSSSVTMSWDGVNPDTLKIVDWHPK